MFRARLYKFLYFLKSRSRVILCYLSAIALGVFVLLVYEVRTSRLQSKFFSNSDNQINFELKPGASKRIRFPKDGPFDIRLGYTRIPTIEKNLEKQGFYTEAQSEMSEKMAALMDKGLSAIYHEKNQAGLKVLDRNNEVIYSVARPERPYQDFKSIPDVVVQSILFIENKEILETGHPHRNPAVEWDRLARAVLLKFLQIFNPSISAPGGSTIATQLEKYMHGYQGRTRNAKDKIIQMLSASYRAYLDGRETFNTRQKIVLDYINSIPLAALRGYGEVNGLGDGLWAWYGLELDKVNALFAEFSPEKAKANPTEYAETYKKILSLFIAHRRPSYYLLGNSEALDSLTNEYLSLVAAANIIPQELRDEALKVKLVLKNTAPPTPTVSFIERKAANAIRTRLLKIIKFRQLYDLDQIDLTVSTSLDRDINRRVSEILKQLEDKKNVAKYGLGGDRTLGQGDPSKVIYSMTLYERAGNYNLLRVQTDNLDRPFDINEGTRLDLGSTAKLRVLSNNLEIISEIYEQFSKLDLKGLQTVLKNKPDVLSSWVANLLISNPKITIGELLEKAMLRTYSASPNETFFTGGGNHTFVNFKKEDNGRTVTVQEALRNSINLPFIRMIRDNLKYYTSQLSDDQADVTVQDGESKRDKYLAKFADKEGSYFLRTFYQKYRGKTNSEIVSSFVKNARPTPRRLAMIFRHLKPQKSISEFSEFFSDHIPNSVISQKLLESLFNTYDPAKFSLNDQGYIAGVHPLELWLVGFMINNQEVNFDQIVEASKDERQQVYEWLKKKKNKRAQDVRIRTLIEAEGFLEMYKSWKRLGYPYQSMVPSYASAIGTSGDRPAALAELMGIIVNDGLRLPMERMEKLHFAEKTPFETVISLDKNAKPERVMRPEIAAVLKKALADVVENGTARRVHNMFKSKDPKSVLSIGGKTGTGDHRYDSYGKGGQLISSRVVNRTATFVFYLGDKFFGTVTAHVHGEQAAKYNFTSALAAEVLKIISPAIEPMVLGTNTLSEPVAEKKP